MPTFHNDEQALRYMIKFAYISAIDQYLKVEELPFEKGIADAVYLPKKKSLLPALIVELKWDKLADGDVGGEIVMVGINHDSKAKALSCKIEHIYMGII